MFRSLRKEIIKHWSGVAQNLFANTQSASPVMELTENGLLITGGQWQYVKDIIHFAVHYSKSGGKETVRITDFKAGYLETPFHSFHRCLEAIHLLAFPAQLEQEVKHQLAFFDAEPVHGTEILAIYRSTGLGDPLRAQVVTNIAPYFDQDAKYLAPGIKELYWNLRRRPDLRAFDRELNAWFEKRKADRQATYKKAKNANKVLVPITAELMRTGKNGKKYYKPGQKFFNGDCK